MHRVAWDGLTSYCTSQIFRSPAFPLLEVFRCLFSLLSVSGEVNFKSCLNCAGHAGRDSALAHSPARSSRQCCWSAQPIAVSGSTPGRERASALTGAQDFQLQMSDPWGIPKSMPPFNQQAGVNQAGSKQLLLWKPSGLDRRDTWQGPSGRQYLYHLLQRSALRRCSSSGTRGLLIACMWLRALLYSGSGVSPNTHLPSVLAILPWHP